MDEFHEKYARELINQAAEKIKKEIIGGMICDIPIDMNHINHLIVAAYYYGRGDMFAKKPSIVQSSEEESKSGGQNVKGT